MVLVRRSFEASKSCLYICSTPIGNLQDATFRLIETLQKVDVVAAEDTRHTRKLLTHFDIHPPVLLSYHEHNRHSRAEDLKRFWQEGKSVALVSDAGTPGVSDPGWDAVQLAVEEGVPVVAIPGASAVLTALVGSGLPMQPFTFLGFLPRDKKGIVDELKRYDGLPGSVVFYESPHRLEKTLQQIAAHWPARDIALCKELTKKHETYITGTVEEVTDYLGQEGTRGEYVVVLGPSATAGITDALESEEEKLTRAVVLVDGEIESGVSHKVAVKTIAASLGVSRNELYQRTLK